MKYVDYMKGNMCKGTLTLNYTYRQGHLMLILLNRLYDYMH